MPKGRITIMYVQVRESLMTKFIFGRGTVERQTMQKQHNGLNVFDSMEAQKAGLRADPVSPSTSDSSVTALHLHRYLPAWDRNHVDYV